MSTVWRATCTIKTPHNTWICVNKISSTATLTKGIWIKWHLNTMVNMTTNRNYLSTTTCQINIMCRKIPSPKNLMNMKFLSRDKMTLSIVVPKSARDITVLRNWENINKFSKFHRQRKAQILSPNFPTILTWWMRGLRFFILRKSLAKVSSQKFIVLLISRTRMTSSASKSSSHSKTKKVRGTLIMSTPLERSFRETQT